MWQKAQLFSNLCKTLFFLCTKRIYRLLNTLSVRISARMSGLLWKIFNHIPISPVKINRSNKVRTKVSLLRAYRICSFVQVLLSILPECGWGSGTGSWSAWRTCLSVGNLRLVNIELKHDYGIAIIRQHVRNMLTWSEASIDNFVRSLLLWESSTDSLF